MLGRREAIFNTSDCKIDEKYAPDRSRPLPRAKNTKKRPQTKNFIKILINFDPTGTTTATTTTTATATATTTTNYYYYCYYWC